MAAGQARRGRHVQAAGVRLRPARPGGHGRCSCSPRSIIGSVPRMGKTFLLRLLLLICALDVRAEIHAYDLKGTGDLAPLRPVAHRYRAGDDPEDIEYLVADFRALRTEMRRRTKVIRDMADKHPQRCPENKVTPELASDRRLGLHPIAVAIDECQVAFEHPVYGAEMEAICTDLVKRGPALGIILDARHAAAGRQVDPDRHQRERRAADVPEGHGPGRERHGARHQPVQGRHPRDDVRVRRQGRCSTSPARGCARGSSAPSTSTARMAKVIVARARVMRESAGRITGYALGEDGDQEVPVVRRRRADGVRRRRQAVVRDDRRPARRVDPLGLRGHHPGRRGQPAARPRRRPSRTSARPARGRGPAASATLSRRPRRSAGPDA